MAVIQISKIQVRRGLQENLPQLAAGELGYSTDQRRLWIGNGLTSAPDYAPEGGNTEILTIFSPTGAALSNIAVLEANVSALTNQVNSLIANSATSTFNVVLNDAQITFSNTAIIFFGNLTTNSGGGIVDYKISRGSNVRVGTLQISSAFNTVSYYEDSYQENIDIGVTLKPFTFGCNSVIQFTTTNTGVSANLTYYSPRSFI